jgi:rod shape-determining protein MreC
MRFIQKRARDEISIGEMIVTSGLGGIYPPGINIGRVNIIKYQENEISMEVELDASIDFSRLEYVFVIDAAAASASEAPNG